MDEETLTPLPPQKPTLAPRTMDFPDAIRQIMTGKKISRVSWGNTDYGLLKDGWLTIWRKDKFSTWLVSDGDIDGNDWIIVGEVN